MSVTSRRRIVPPLIPKLNDKSVQFAEENTILVIDNENQLLANGQVINSDETRPVFDINRSKPMPILKNGPKPPRPKVDELPQKRSEK